MQKKKLSEPTFTRGSRGIRRPKESFKEYPIRAKYTRGRRYRNAKRIYDPITKRYRLVELKGQQYYD